MQRVALILTFASSALLAAMTFGYSDNVNTWREGARIVHPFGDVQIGTFIQRLQTLVGLAAAAGVAARGFLIRSADLEFAKQFATTRETFEVALNRIAEIRDEDAERDLPEVFERLGREALLEQAEWLWLRHSRPFEAPS